MVVAAAGAMHVRRGGVSRWRVMVVMAVIVVMAVVVPAKVPTGGIGAVFRFKRFIHLGHDQVHGAQHVDQHMVGLDLQVIGLELNRHMAVAQVVGDADQVKRRAVVGVILLSSVEPRKSAKNSSMIRT